MKQKLYKSRKSGDNNIFAARSAERSKLEYPKKDGSPGKIGLSVVACEAEVDQESKQERGTATHEDRNHLIFSWLNPFS